MVVLLFAERYYTSTGIYLLNVHHTINHMDKYYAKHVYVNYVHAQTVDTRLFLPTHREPGYEARSHDHKRGSHDHKRKVTRLQGIT